MRTLRLTLAYDGTNYVGWQRQLNGVSIQQLVEEAWVVIWPEHLGSKEFLAGIDLEQLQADYQELTGEALTLPPGS